MFENYSAGDYIEAWCTKCRLELGHTIVAMVDNAPRRVKCNTCNSEHNFRAKPSGKKRTKGTPSIKKTKSRNRGYRELISRLSDSDPSNAKKYSIEGNFEKDEIIYHPTFGLGIVSSVVQADKVEILFRDGPRLLVQNRQSLAV
ncbi:MAG: hypothetical protein GXP46_13385 [Deferribacteres bacterium]|nr:hypothetical protein [Deferribacteres bacterium]